MKRSLLFCLAGSQLAFQAQAQVPECSQSALISLAGKIPSDTAECSTILTTLTPLLGTPTVDQLQAFEDLDICACLDTMTAETRAEFEAGLNCQFSSAGINLAEKSTCTTTDAPATDAPAPAPAPATDAPATDAPALPTDCKTAYGGLKPLISVVFSPSNANVGEICADNEGAAVKAQMSNALDACNAPALADNAFEMVDELLCEQDRDGDYCVVSLLSIVPTSQLITALADPSSFDVNSIDFYANINNDQYLPKICASPSCTNRIAKQAVEKMRALGFGSEARQVMDIAKAAKAACEMAGNVSCSKQQFVTDDGAINTTVACKNGRLTPCARKILTTRYAGDEFEETLCGAEGERHDIASAVLRLTNLAYTYFEQHKDEIIRYIKQDLGFNIPGLMEADIDLDIQPSADGESVVVNIKIDGDWDVELEQELNVMAVMTALQQLLADNDVVFPFLDTMAADGVIDSNELAAAAAILENLIDTTTPPPSTLPPSAAQAPSVADDDNTDDDNTDGSVPTATDGDDNDTESVNGAASRSASAALLVAAGALLL